MFYVITFDEAPLPKLSIKHLFIATPTRVHVGLRLDDCCADADARVVAHRMTPSSAPGLQSQCLNSQMMLVLL